MQKFEWNKGRNLIAHLASLENQTPKNVKTTGLWHRPMKQNNVISTKNRAPQATWRTVDIGQVAEDSLKQLVRQLVIRRVSRKISRLQNSINRKLRRVATVVFPLVIRLIAPYKLPFLTTFEHEHTIVNRPVIRNTYHHPKPLPKDHSPPLGPIPLIRRRAQHAGDRISVPFRQNSIECTRKRHPTSSALEVKPRLAVILLVGVVEVDVGHRCSCGARNRGT